MALSFSNLKPLLRTGARKGSGIFSYLGLGAGVLLLLCSVQMFINIREILGEKTVKKDEFDYISITKTITNETMGNAEKNAFNRNEIEEISQKPFIEDVSPLISNQFRIQLSAGSIIPFQTDLFIESLDDPFIDTVPPEFKWQPGQIDIPIIFASDFLEIYNVFAPGQDLPQISKETATGIQILLSCEGNGYRQTYRARIVAFSDRINSVLVPKSFLDWANQTFGEKPEGANRIFLKTKDANNPELLNYLDQMNYSLNKDKTKFGRVKQVLQAVFAGLGIFGLLVVILALMLFSFYLQLLIARSRDSLMLLLTLGYSPSWLTKNVSTRFIPVYVGIILAALIFAQLIQYGFYRFALQSRPDMSPFIHWSLILTAVLLIALSVFTNFAMVKKQISKLDFNI